MLLGHAHPEVIGAVAAGGRARHLVRRADAAEVELAEEIVDRTPVEQVRLVNSGTEATMSVLRLARGITGRDKIVKFAGCYHGHVDALLASAGSGVATLGACPARPGVTGGDHRRHDRRRRTTTVAAVREAFADVRRPDRLP